MCNKQAWILKHTEGQKGRSWAHVKQGDGINAPQPSHPAQTQDSQRTDISSKRWMEEKQNEKHLSERELAKKFGCLCLDLVVL